MSTHENSGKKHNYTERELAILRKKRRLKRLKRRRRKLIFQMLLVFLLLVSIPIFILKGKNEKDIKNASNILNTFYASFVEENSLPADNDSASDFAEWFASKHLHGKIKEITNYVENDSLTNEIIYDII